MSHDSTFERLTDLQKQLVADNLALVGLHLRRHPTWTNGRCSAAERDDLFQEGCIGLMHAAQTYDPKTGMAFAVYALPRIHTAVNRARRAGFSTIRQRLYRRRSDAGDAGPTRPRSVALDFDPGDRRSDARHHPEAKPVGETIGAKITERYVQAVRQAAERLKRTRPSRPDRAGVLDRIVEHRLLVPEPEARLSFRALARATGSSYGRVAQCEKRLLELVRAKLADDAETRRLRDEARRHAGGMDAPISPDLTAELDRIRIDKLVTHLTDATPEQRDTLLQRLCAAAGTTPGQIARTLIDTIDPDRRAAFLDSSP
ncbi:MAG: hypothetical protein GY778_31500 [bacterium]|nr:hypothetical protein [bacterium]